MQPLPRWLFAPFTLGVAVLAVPLIGLLLSADWAALPSLLTSARALDALRLSLATCCVSTVIVLLVGVPLALVLARSEAWWGTVVRTLVTVPMALPPVVAGLALLTTFGRRGLLGRVLEVAGIQVGFTTVAVVMAQTFVALPFLVTSLEGALRTQGTKYDAVSASLGASPSRTLWRVTLPLMWPAIASGTALSFARALGEFGATLTFAGSLQGVTRTLPLEIYLLREQDADTAIALSVVLIALALLIVCVAGRQNTWRVGRR